MFTGGGRFSGPQRWLDVEEINVGDEGVVLKMSPNGMYPFSCSFPHCARVGLKRTDFEPMVPAQSPDAPTPPRAQKAERRSRRSDARRAAPPQTSAPLPDSEWELDDSQACPPIAADSPAPELHPAGMPRMGPGPESPSTQGGTTVSTVSPPHRCPAYSVAASGAADSPVEQLSRSRDDYFTEIVRSTMARVDPSRTIVAEATDAVLSLQCHSGCDPHDLAATIATDISAHGAALRPEQVSVDFTVRGGAVVALHFTKQQRQGRAEGRPLSAERAAACIVALSAALNNPSSMLRHAYSATLLWPSVPAPSPNASPALTAATQMSPQPAVVPPTWGSPYHRYGNFGPVAAPHPPQAWSSPMAFHQQPAIRQHWR